MNLKSEIELVQKHAVQTSLKEWNDGFFICFLSPLAEANDYQTNISTASWFEY